MNARVAQVSIGLALFFTLDGIAAAQPAKPVRELTLGVRMGGLGRTVGFDAGLLVGGDRRLPQPFVRRVSNRGSMTLIEGVVRAGVYHHEPGTIVSSGRFHTTEEAGDVRLRLAFGVGLEAAQQGVNQRKSGAAVLVGFSVPMMFPWNEETTKTLYLGKPQAAR